ncbi:Uncharacterized protein At4g15545 [Linum perenne]
MNHKARTPQSLSEQSTNQKLEQMTKQEVEVDCRAMSSDVASSSGELESSRKWLNSRRKRYSLAINVKKLSRDSAKVGNTIHELSFFLWFRFHWLVLNCLVVQLENFKRQLMQSLNDDSQSQADAVDIRTYDQSVPRAYPDEDEVTNGYESENSYSGSADSGTVGEAWTPRIDGKEFFRQARSRLSYEQFSAFLANIKELNAQRQT